MTVPEIWRAEGESCLPGRGDGRAPRGGPPHRRIRWSCPSPAAPSWRRGNRELLRRRRDWWCGCAPTWPPSPAGWVRRRRPPPPRRRRARPTLAVGSTTERRTGVRRRSPSWYRRRGPPASCRRRWWPRSRAHVEAAAAGRAGDGRRCTRSSVESRVDRSYPVLVGAGALATASASGCRSGPSRAAIVTQAGGRAGRSTPRSRAPHLRRSTRARRPRTSRPSSSCAAQWAVVGPAPGPTSSWPSAVRRGHRRRRVRRRRVPPGDPRHPRAPPPSSARSMRPSGGRPA